MQCDIYSLLYPLHFTVQALYSAVFLRFLCTFALWSILFYFLNIMKVALEVIKVAKSIPFFPRIYYKIFQSIFRNGFYFLVQILKITQFL